jgi:uncharacterized membrane protein YgdD (TMEM256/DUF423 family)
VLTEQRVLVAITPIGGLLMLLGWLFLAIAVVSQTANEKD